jgi:hypothetical protein
MKQYWIYSPYIDGIFILAPALVISGIIFGLQDGIADIEVLPDWLWVVLVIGVDVAHVYSTIFRTYLDRNEFRARRTLYTLTPFICWVVGALLYNIDGLVFWRAITYFAVFHFVRQQYGFMMIYGGLALPELTAKAIIPKYYKKIDQYAIYSATLYPLIYWHTHLPRHFDWFIADDFITIDVPFFNSIALLCYIAILVAYIIKEVTVFFKYHTLNIAKNLLLFGTAISWWMGIIYFNNDIAFTAINVIAHGVPYIALIWIYGRNNGRLYPEKKIFGIIGFQRFFSLLMLPVFIISLVLFSYIEEGLWDGFIWIEHKSIFAFFQGLPTVTDKATLAWLVPLLALPQTTHYALDAFIWQLSAKDTDWKETLFYKR